MLFTFVFFTRMLVTFMLFLMMNNRAIRNIVFTKLRVFVSSAEIQATDIVLIGKVMGVAIIDRLSFQAQLKL